VKSLLKFVFDEIVNPAGKGTLVNWHGHSDRGLGLMNALAAVEAGADIIHGTALGLGERVGNTQMDQLLVNLKLLGLIDNDLSALAAVEAGAHIMHGTALGLGERVGNAQMDQLLVNLKLLGLIGNDLSALAEYVRKAHQYTGVPLPENYPVFGEDAFDTGTGV